MSSYNIIFNSIVFILLSANLIVAFIVKGKNKHGQVSTEEVSPFLHHAAAPSFFGTIAVTFSIVGTIVGGGMFLVVGQMGYEAGILGYITGLVYLVGIGIMACFAKRMRCLLGEHKCFTLIDLIEKVYSRRIAIIFSVVSFFLYFFLLAGQFVAINTMLKFMNSMTANSTGIYVLTGYAVLSLFLYPIIGGLEKDITTDIIQVVVIIIASFAIVMSFNKAPYIPIDWDKVPTDLLTGTGYGTVFLIGLILFYIPSFFVRMDFWQRVITAKTPEVATRAFMLSGVVSMLFFILFTTIGIWARISGVTDGKMATLTMLMTRISSPTLLGLLLGAFFAAVLSSADTFINNSSLFLTKFIFNQDWLEGQKDKIKGRMLLWKSRIIAIVITLVSLVLAWYVPDFVDLLVGAFSLLLIFLPMIFGLLFNFWRHEGAAFWSSAIGLGIFIVTFFTINPKLAFAPGVVTSFLIYLGFVLKMNKKEIILRLLD